MPLKACLLLPGENTADGQNRTIKEEEEQTSMPTQADAAVLQQVTEVVEHGLLVLTANTTEVAQEAAAAGHHLWEGNLLGTHTETRMETSNVIQKHRI